MKYVPPQLLIISNQPTTIIKSSSLFDLEVVNNAIRQHRQLYSRAFPQ